MILNSDMTQGPYNLIDAHVHLHDASFDADRPAVLARARAAGIRYLINNGACESDWPVVAQLARDIPDVLPCFGLHPWYVNERSDTWLETLEQYLRQVPGAVGEIGLDRWINGRDEAAQEQCFLAQLDLARALERPVTLHVLRAWDWLMALIKHQPRFPAGIVFHAFGGPAELIEPLVRKNAYFSVAGAVLRSDRAKAHAAVRTIPADRLLVETDAPDLPPPAYCLAHTPQAGTKTRNEPAHLARIFAGIAELRDDSPEALAALVYQNSLSLFGPMIHNTPHG